MGSCFEKLIARSPPIHPLESAYIPDEHIQCVYAFAKHAMVLGQPKQPGRLNPWLEEAARRHIQNVMGRVQELRVRLSLRVDLEAERCL